MYLFPQPLLRSLLLPLINAFASRITKRSSNVTFVLTPGKMSTEFAEKAFPPHIAAVTSSQSPREPLPPKRASFKASCSFRKSCKGGEPLRMSRTLDVLAGASQLAPLDPLWFVENQVRSQDSVMVSLF